eukprot:SAG25_NODE_444_length_7964_cov_123.610807_5_plen_78_part_00
MRGECNEYGSRVVLVHFFRHVVQVLSQILYTHQDGSRLPSKKCVDGSDNRLGKFLFQIIEATRGGMPARDGNIDLHE